MLRIFLSFVVGIGLLGCATFTWIAMRQPPLPPPAPKVRVAVAPAPIMVKVLVAARDIHAGAFLQANDLASADFTIGSMPADAERDTPSTRRALEGALVLHGVPQAMLVDRNDLILPGDHGFLAALLPPGMRAITIGRDVLNADAGLLSPGDRIDVILAQTAPADAVGGRRFAAETVISGVRVLAIDRQLVPGNASVPDHGGPAPLPAAITLQVSPAQAERLVIAERLGKLDFALRSSSPNETDAAGSPHVTWAGDVMSSLNKPTDPPGPAVTMHVLDGAGGDKEYQY